MKTPDDRVTAWIAMGAAEDQRLDFKESLNLSTRSDRKELLKDLTGMGNGGGGVVAFGIAERKEGSEAVADRVMPLEDRDLLSRLGDIVGDAVRPTLLWHPQVVEQPDGGFVLIVEVSPSPLGPYMVDAHDDHRYWRRAQTSTRPMSERLVHDLYALAARWDDQRAEVWARLGLPLDPTWSSGPWLTASGVPEHLIGEPFDPAQFDQELLFYDRAGTDHARIAGLHQHPAAVTVWADGFLAQADADREARHNYPRGPQSVLRIHRNGAIGMGVHLATRWRIDAVRALNAQLDYLGQLWEEVGLQRGELRIELTHLHPGPSNVDGGSYPSIPRDRATPPASILLTEFVRVPDLRVAPQRHQLLRRFADRLANCFGEIRQRRGFDHGTLYGSAGLAGGQAGDGSLHRDIAAAPQEAFVADDGSVRPSWDLSPIGWWEHGVLMDLDGNAVAAVEFAEGPGLPADFMPVEVDREDGPAPPLWTPERAAHGLRRPLPSARWSESSFPELMSEYRNPG